MLTSHGDPSSSRLAVTLKSRPDYWKFQLVRDLEKIVNV